MMEEVVYSGICACGCGGTTGIATRNDKVHNKVRGRYLLYINHHNRRGKPAKATHKWREKNRKLKHRGVTDEGT